MKITWNESAKDKDKKVTGDKATIVIKGRNEGISRPEFDYSIPVSDAKELIRLFCTDIISKTRYLVPYDKHTIEVDEFKDKNEGLFIAEVEFDDDNENIENPPEWLKKEVSYDNRYYNSELVKYPYSEWFIGG